MSTPYPNLTMVPDGWSTMDINARLAWVNQVGAGWNNPTALNQTIDSVVSEYVRQNYPSLAPYLNDATIGPLVLQAGREGWTPEVLQAKLEQTPWWQTTAASQRQFDALQYQDPATAKQKVDQQKAAISTLVSTEGITGLTDAQLTSLATQQVRNGVTDAGQTKAQVLALATYNPANAQPVGTLGAAMTRVKNAAEAYLVPMSDASAFNWAQQVESGKVTEDAVTQYLMNVAKGQYATLAPQIDQGLTTRQLVDPQIQKTAQLLEVDPNTIDPMNQKYAPIVSYNDPTTNTPRVMTLAETENYVKGLSDWKQTDNANQSAAALGLSIIKQFGKAS